VHRAYRYRRLVLHNYIDVEPIVSAAQRTGVSRCVIWFCPGVQSWRFVIVGRSESGSMLAVWCLELRSAFGTAGTAPHPRENVPSATSASHVPICRLEDEATALPIYRVSHQNESVAGPAELVPVVRDVDQFLRDAHRAKARGGPALTIVQRVTLAVDAAMREILPARLDATAQPVTLEGSVAFPAVITVNGGLALPPIRFGGHGTVQDRRAVIVGRVLVLVILWLLVLVGPAAIMKANLSSGGHDDAGCLLRSYRRDRRGGHHRLLPNTNQECPGPYATETKSDKHRQNQDVEPHMHSKDQDYACSQQQQRSEHAGTKSGTSLIPEYLHLKCSDHGKNNQLGTKRPVRLSRNYDQDRNQKDRRVQA
jgi:hypothetical protein